MQPLFLFRMIALSAVCAGGAATARPLEIAIAQGRIAGVESGPVQSFHAIPYAVAPVGTLRWAPPQPVARYTRPAQRGGDRELTSA